MAAKKKRRKAKRKAKRKTKRKASTRRDGLTKANDAMFQRIAERERKKTIFVVVV